MLDLNRERQQWKQEGVLLGRQEGVQLGRQEGREEGVQLGRKEGVQLGRQEGVQLGREEGVRNTAKRMLKQAIFTDEQITLATGLSLAQVTALKQAL